MSAHQVCQTFGSHSLSSMRARIWTKTWCTKFPLVRKTPSFLPCSQLNHQHQFTESWSLVHKLIVNQPSHSGRQLQIWWRLSTPKILFILWLHQHPSSLHLKCLYKSREVWKPLISLDGKIQLNVRWAKENLVSNHLRLLMDPPPCLCLGKDRVKLTLTI